MEEFCACFQFRIIPVSGFKAGGFPQYTRASSDGSNLEIIRQWMKQTSLDSLDTADFAHYNSVYPMHPTQGQRW
jgi:hypothetical protein